MTVGPSGTLAVARRSTSLTAGSVIGWGLPGWSLVAKFVLVLRDWVDAPIAWGQFDGPCPLQAPSRPSLAVLLASPRPPRPVDGLVH
eukprot:15438338-Alexandrium_andersonii.AAC.1